MRRPARQRVRRFRMPLLAMALTAGCLGDSGISVDVDEKEARFVRSNVVKTFDRSWDLASRRSAAAS